MIPTRSHKTKILIVILSLIGLILITASSSSYWELLDGKIVPHDVQKVGRTQTFLKPRLAGDLDGDGDTECLVSSGESLHITNCVSEILWESPADWRVTEVQMGDMNHEGVDEAVLLVWRPFKPWPADRFMPYGGRIEGFHNSNGDSCQIILIGWENDNYRETWAGSALANPVSSVRVADLDGDGLLELAALENDYDSKQKGGQLTVWRWLGFGFSLLDRTESRWERLAIMGDGVHHWLFTR